MRLSVFRKSCLGRCYRLPQIEPKPVSSSQVQITTFEAGVGLERVDVLAVEEPLEIRVRTSDRLETISVTMRTPGHDFDLAIGYLLAEGVIQSRDDLKKVSRPDDLEEHLRGNVVEVEFRSSLKPDLDGLKRLHATSSACGVCGTANLESLHARLKPIISSVRVTPGTVCALPEKLRAAQGIFEATGGLHASALFDLEGNLQAVREDIGRHNALDKLVGHAVLEETRLENSLVLVSGRAGFEIAQKCVAARVPILCAVGAPSSLAVDLARAFNLTLIGFLRGERFNVYSGLERIIR
jgi:FdhD protein